MNGTKHDCRYALRRPAKRSRDTTDSVIGRVLTVSMPAVWMPFKRALGMDPVPTLRHE